MVSMKETDYVVVWSGRDSLLPDRQERWDSRYSSMPSFDIDDGEVDNKSRARRKYVRTGKHKGIFSRTNPASLRFKAGVRYQKEHQGGQQTHGSAAYADWSVERKCHSPY